MANIKISQFYRMCYIRGLYVEVVCGARVFEVVDERRNDGGKHLEVRQPVLPKK